MGESSTSTAHGEASAGVSRSLAAPRPDGDEERPIALLLLCAVMAAGAFVVPMWASSLFSDPSPAVQGVESTTRMQSMVHRVVLKPPTPGHVLPQLRARLPEPVNACVDPVAWRER